MGWEIIWVNDDSPNLGKFLAEGWEPFAVTVAHDIRIWLRRQRK